MNIWPLNVLRRRMAAVARKEAQKEIEVLYRQLPHLIAFHTSRPEERQDAYDHTKDAPAYFELAAHLREELVLRGIEVVEATVNLSSFEAWMQQNKILVRFYESMGASQIQKLLEHYLVHREIAFEPGQLYVDVGAKTSPWASLLRKRGVEAWRLDRDYPPGRHGMDIGADACATGLPDASVHAVSLQCAYNCLAGEADILFLREADRILKPGGTLVIVPLCLDSVHYCTRSAYCDLSGLEPDPGALWLWRSDGYRLPFTRTYSPSAFQERVIKNLPATLVTQVHFLTNLPELWQRYPGQRIYGCFYWVCRKLPEGSSNRHT